MYLHISLWFNTVIGSKETNDYWNSWRDINGTGDPIHELNMSKGQWEHIEDFFIAYDMRTKPKTNESGLTKGLGLGCLILNAYQPTNGNQLFAELLPSDSCRLYAWLPIYIYK